MFERKAYEVPADLRVVGLDDVVARELRAFSRASGMPLARLIEELWALRSEVEERHLRPHGLELRTL